MSQNLAHFLCINCAIVTNMEKAHYKDSHSKHLFSILK